MMQPSLSFLLVDDDPGIGRCLAREFRMLGASLLATSTEWEALRLGGAAGPDVVLCDLSLPGAAAVPFLREVKRRWPHTLRVLISGVTDGSAESLCEEGLAFTLITKPWTREQLEDLVEVVSRRVALRAERLSG